MRSRSPPTSLRQSRSRSRPWSSSRRAAAARFEPTGTRPVGHENGIGTGSRRARSHVRPLARPRLGPPGAALSLALVAVVLATTALAFAVGRRRAAPRRAHATIARYRYLLVNAATLPLAGRRPVVLVDTMRDLARLAKLHEELIVHAAAPGLHRFALFTDAVVYAYEIRTRHRLPPTRRASPVGPRRARGVRGRTPAHAPRPRRASPTRRPCRAELHRPGGRSTVRASGICAC